MRETDKSNFTIDIFADNMRSPTTQNVNPGPSDANVEKLVRCPVCSVFQDVKIIQEHAAACAEEQFPNIVSSDEDSDKDDLPEVLHIHKNTVFSLETLKDLLAGCMPQEKEALKLRVTRGAEFDSFVDRFSEKWVQKKIGVNIVVHFVGEAGVDQGGPRKEFFTGKFLFFIFQYISFYLYH